MSPTLQKELKKSEEKIKNLKTLCPRLLKDIKYISCGEGWLPLIESLCLLIESRLDQIPLEIRGEIYAVQIKEKFGGLRFYMNESVPYIDGAVEFAEAMSYSICEDCGAPGLLRQGAWIRVRCNKHEATYKRRQKATWEKEKARAEKANKLKGKL